MAKSKPSGNISLNLQDGVAHLNFEHPKSNSLPSSMLNKLAKTIRELGEQEDLRVLVLSSGGTRTFCAGASFDELLGITDKKAGKEFFMGFARVIEALRTFPYFTIGRIQGKAVGGGVGLAAACDYTFANDRASARLSELAIGIGAFVIGPVVERKIGSAAFIEMCVDTEWKSAKWCKRNGLFTKVFEDRLEMEEAMSALTQKLIKHSPTAIIALKSALWHGTDHWPSLLEKRAAESGKLVLSEETKKLLTAFKAKRKSRY